MVVVCILVSGKFLEWWMLREWWPMDEERQFIYTNGVLPASIPMTPKKPLTIISVFINTGPVKHSFRTSHSSHEEYSLPQKDDSIITKLCVKGSAQVTLLLP